MSTENASQPLLSKLQARALSCRRCAQAGLPAYGQPICSGSAAARLMIVGQAPSSSDERNHRLWTGPAGQRLMEWMAWVGLPEVTLRSRHYLTAVCKCYPGFDPSGQGDRAPSQLQVALCRQYLHAELALVAPRLIVPVGRLAIDFFGGQGQRLERLVGRAIAAEGTWIVPLPHPSGASTWLNQPDHQQLLARALAILRELCLALGIIDDTSSGLYSLVNPGRYRWQAN